MGVNASGADVVTTTYGYDSFGARVLQITATTTTLYPFKWYSVASSTGAGAQYASTTEYVFSGDTLVSTIDQQLAGGVATGSPQTLYIHPDHLGSTNIVTDEDGDIIETLDYFPYGATRVSTGVNASARKCIGLFGDQSNLIYANARYYDPNRGQFISQDPIFQQLGSLRAERMADRSLLEILKDPQALNSYSYAKNNPINIKDPSGLIDSKTATVLGLYAQVLNLLSQIVVQMGGGGSAGKPRCAAITWTSLRIGVTLKVRKSWHANRPASRSRCPSRKPRVPNRQAALGNLILFIWPRTMSIAARPARSWRTTSPLMKMARKCGSN